jgi:hypothetical protein
VSRHAAATLSRFEVRYAIRATPFLAIACVACGDNALPCAYAEHDDIANATTAEMTGVTVTDHGVHVCGALDGGHLDPQLHAIDDDAYRITVDVDGPMLVEIHGDSGVELLDDVLVRFFDTATNPRLLGQGRFDPAIADHGAFLVDLAPGVYDMIVTARASGDLSGSLPYRIRLSPMPECATRDEPVDYREAHDADNGAVDVDFSRDPSFTPVAGATPEPTRVHVVAGEQYLIDGTIGTEPHADEYLDRDTFAIATDDSPNELAIRLDWTGDASDLDYVVFEADTMTPVVASNLASSTVRELAMFPVKPSTAYWLWIGAFRGSSATSYRASVCGWHFFY